MARSIATMFCGLAGERGMFLPCGWMDGWNYCGLGRLEFSLFFHFFLPSPSSKYIAIFLWLFTPSYSLSVVL